MGEKIDQAKGRTKEALGDLTGNTKLKNEGKMDRQGAAIKGKVGDAVDAVKDKVEAVANKAHDAFGSKSHR